MKPYQLIPIVECREPLVPIPTDQFSLLQPHPYVKLGAPYGQRSPYSLRQGVLDRLKLALAKLQNLRPHWNIQVFDAYRPVGVQQFMVDYTLATMAQAQGLDPLHLQVPQREALLEQVYQFWAQPSLDMAYPPPHSTGGSVDVTLVDETGQTVNMGSPIDEASPRSYPNHFEKSPDPQEQQYHRDRQLLNTVMSSAGFCRHPNEWWHFSYGDQMWAWTMNRGRFETMLVAHYGRVD